MRVELVASETCKNQCPLAGGLDPATVKLVPLAGLLSELQPTLDGKGSTGPKGRSRGPRRKWQINTA